MTRTIPSHAFPYKEGLYINEYTLSAGGRTWTVWELFASHGYCFYDLQIPENYDDSGSLRPENERVYYTYAKMHKDEAYVTNNIIPVPFKEGYEET